jgi:UDP-glucose 4-epimerase
MLREYVISEAMSALGIPTTRSLAVVTTGEPVYRESVKRGAVLTRVAQSHLRVGTFEYLAARRDEPALRALADYAAAYGWGYAALRYFNAAGASADGTYGEDHTPETHLVPLVLGALLGGPPITIAGCDWPTPDGTPIRDYVHLDDLARAHVIALDAIQPGTFEAFNVGTGNGQSVREVIAVAEKITGREIPTTEGTRRPGDPARLIARNDLARERLGFTPERSIEDIVRSAWRWHESHPKGYGGMRVRPGR